MLQLSDYRELIHLDDPFPAPANDQRSDFDVLMTALSGLQNKHYTGTSSLSHLMTEDNLMRWLFAELTAREPGDLNPIAERAINTLLYRYMGKKGRIEARNLRRVSQFLPKCDFPYAEKLVLYHGDIRQLVTDAVVDPALPELTGCPIPLHNCLDWHLHASAGPWLRNDAAKIIELQGHNEQPGHAKITRGYRLPARFVIHTVGPDVATTGVTDVKREELRNCYVSSLNLAAEQGSIHSIAFPAISTGLSGFPPEEAAQIALSAISDWMLVHHDSSIDLIIISVRYDEDAAVYTHVLSEWLWS